METIDPTPTPSPSPKPVTKEVVQSNPVWIPIVLIILGLGAVVGLLLLGLKLLDQPEKPTTQLPQEPEEKIEPLPINEIPPSQETTIKFPDPPAQNL
jgi:hypothetical protein